MMMQNRQNNAPYMNGLPSRMMPLPPHMAGAGMFGVSSSSSAHLEGSGGGSIDSNSISSWSTAQPMKPPPPTTTAPPQSAADPRMVIIFILLTIQIFIYLLAFLPELELGASSIHISSFFHAVGLMMNYSVSLSKKTYLNLY